MDRTATFYASPTYEHRGGGLPIYSGSRRQRGGSILGAIKNLFMPLLPGVKNYAVKKAKTAARDFVAGTVSDIMRGKPILQAAKSNAFSTAAHTAQSTRRDIQRQISGSRKRAKSTNNRKRRPAAKRARKIANF